MQSHSLNPNHERLRRLRQALATSQPPTATTPVQIAGIPPEMSASLVAHLPAQHIPAAVLVPLVLHPDEPTILLTERASHLRQHAGQISFPGGRMEASDAGPKDTALRESFEEIGLPPDAVDVLGYLPPHIVFTGYCIMPVVALIQPGLDLRPDAREVAGVFEVPLSHVLDARNHQSRWREAFQTRVQVYDIPYGERRIWGATAGILMSLYRLLEG